MKMTDTRVINASKFWQWLFSFYYLISVSLLGLIMVSFYLILFVLLQMNIAFKWFDKATFRNLSFVFHDLSWSNLDIQKMIVYTKFQTRYRSKTYALYIPVLLFGIENDNTFGKSAMFNILWANAKKTALYTEIPLWFMHWSC